MDKQGKFFVCIHGHPCDLTYLTQCENVGQGLGVVPHSDVLPEPSEGPDLVSGLCATVSVQGEWGVAWPEVGEKGRVPEDTLARLNRYRGESLLVGEAARASSRRPSWRTDAP